MNMLIKNQRRIKHQKILKTDLILELEIDTQAMFWVCQSAQISK